MWQNLWIRNLRTVSNWIVLARCFFPCAKIVLRATALKKSCQRGRPSSPGRNQSAVASSNNTAVTLPSTFCACNERGCWFTRLKSSHRILPPSLGECAIRARVASGFCLCFFKPRGPLPTCRRRCRILPAIGELFQSGGAQLKHSKRQ